MTFRNDLQGLRAVAIALVVVFHTGSRIVTGGFIGVDIFFVLSGYLITGILLADIEKKKLNFFKFYANRLKRLLPATVTMICSVFLISFLLLSSLEITQQLASAPYAAIWSSNIYFPQESLNYFNELSAHDLFLHTWSLGVEIQFYLIWPFFISLIYWLFRYSSQYKLALTCATILILILSLVFCITTTKTHPNFAFYFTPFRIWQFSMGTLTYLLIEKTTPIFNGSIKLNSTENMIKRVCTYVGLTSLFICAILYDSNTNYPGVFAAFPSLSTALVIFGGSRSDYSQRHWLSHPVFCWLGNRSYSLYLWHWPILMIGFSFGARGNSIAIFALLALSLVFANISYKYIEIPFWKGPLKFIDHMTYLVFSILLMLCLFFILSITLKVMTIKTSQSELLTIGKHDLPILYLKGCDTWFYSEEVQPCLFSKETAKKDLVLLGDSIGVQWFASILNSFPMDRWRIHVYTKSSCPIVNKPWKYEKIGKYYEVCTNWRNNVLEEIKNINPEILIMGSASTYGFSKKAWVEGTTSILDNLSPNVSSIIIIPGTPGLNFDGPSCLARPITKYTNLFPNMCSTNSSAHPAYNVAEYLTEASVPFDNVNVLNLNDLVCGNDMRCKALSQDGVFVFRDSQHLSNTFVKSRSNKIQRRLQKLLH